MPESAAKQAVSYHSKYEYGVDQKRRLQIPAKWRPEEGEIELTVMVWPKHKEGTCLRVFPPDQMQKFIGQVDAMPNNDPNKITLKRFLGSQSDKLVPDKAGRVCLPEWMAKKAMIENEAVLVGLIDKFEIWSPKLYTAIDTTDQTRIQDALQNIE